MDSAINFANLDTNTEQMAAGMLPINPLLLETDGPGAEEQPEGRDGEVENLVSESAAPAQAMAGASESTDEEDWNSESADDREMDYPDLVETETQGTNATVLYRICIDDYPVTEAATFPCGHSHCQGCLSDQFTLIITDESMFPPRCHCNEELPLGTCRPFLTPELVAEFERKKIEHETPNRTYCHVPTCSTFVPPRSIHGDVATCVKCRAETCTTCKGGAHQDMNCPDNPEVERVKELAALEGWVRCYQCGRLIERTDGCNHIGCICGADFCYLCGTPWKQCTCEIGD
ncbi:hypothetical protein B0T19DRAFT_465270 [Cercophora scortea]|uniref:RBR-type E3 ubiquitin transferase n=1 Tax=Cercophora scortea TaxID=314031 RepID=A0AAE0M5X9_9PEZI|nr:hypothetical protein B0T19DRAFT_465270 [Cercophora scortea]